jgi:D-3-phosphoglycerate dehydrogenase
MQPPGCITPSFFHSFSMPALKILFLDKAHSVLENRLHALGFECHTDIHSSKEAVMQMIGQYVGVVMRSRFSINKTFIENATHLRFIAREGVGTEHIDVSFAEKNGIQVLTSPEGSRDTVGEHTLGLLLCLLNNLSRADRQVRQGDWLREPNRGMELKGKTVGIMGYGNMGSAFARKLSGLQVNVIAYDKFKTGFADGFANEVSMETLWEESDILSLHFPYSPENHYFVNFEFLQKFKKEIFLLNTARGLILETAALVENMKTGKVRGVALDVLEYEETSFDRFRLDELPQEFLFLKESENVILTPHIAGWSFESKEKHASVLADKIEELMRT